MDIIIVGSGNLAVAIARCCDKKDQPYQRWGKESPNVELRESEPYKTVVIHTGSGRQIREATEFCTKHKLIMLQASSQLSEPIPADPGCGIITVPNFAFEVVEFIKQLGPVTKAYAEKGIIPFQIMESHQAKKKSIPLTARQMAKVIEIPETTIVSIRDPEEQIRLGVPREFLDAHGYHWVKYIGPGGVILEQVSKVNGRDPYGYGAIQMAQATTHLWAGITEGVHSFDEFAKGVGI